MRVKNNIRFGVATVLLAVALIVCAALPAQAQEVSVEETIVTVVDTVAADVDSTDAVTPEWYVEPVIPEAKRAPKHAKAAKCSLDSTLSFDVDSVLVEVSAFKYDDADRVTSKTVYACNPDGSRVGTFKEDYGFDATGRQVMTAVYEWVSASSKWKGTEKTEFAYDGELMIQRIDYAWVNEAWVADKKITWKYDEQGRVPEYHEYTRDKNTNQLVDSKARIQEWDSEDRQITDIQYTAYSNGAWTAGTKKEWGYDANGNKTKYIYYAGLTNGNWGATGSTRELWTYDGSNTKTKYEKYTWSNGWVGSQKEEWGYTDGKQTMYAKYAWSNGDWVGVSKEEWNYAAGKQTLYAKYTWQNGAWVGVSKEEWEYASGKDKRHEKFTWSNGAWQTTEREDWTYNGKGKETLYEKQSLESGSLVIAVRRVSEYDGSNNQTLLANYSRKNGALVGTTKETWAYTSGKMTKHNTFVWGSSDWTDSEEEVWAYTSGNETNYEKYVWENGVKTGKTKRTSEYTSGKKTQQINWAWESGAWVDSDKEVWAYTSGKLALNEKYNWVNGAWAYTLREVWAYDGSNQTLHEKYTGENGALVGEEKEVWAYASGKLTLHEVYMWHNSAWAVSSRKEYDDSDREILIETYTIKSGIYTGTKKEEYTFNAAGKTTDKMVYKWQNGAWQKDVRYVKNYDDAGRKTLECSYTGQNNEWKGKSQCLLWTYDSSDRVIDYITQVWSTKKKDWVNNERIATTYYSGDNPLKETYYAWENDAWVEVSWTDYAYNSAGENESVKAYEFDGTSWICVSRIINTFNGDGIKILSVSEYWDWDTETWITDSKEKRDIIYDSAGRQLLDARWTCGSDLKWKGVKKDTAAYNAIGKKIFEAQYTSWKNNNWVPSYKIEAEYDEAGRTLWEQKLNWRNNKWEGQYRNEYTWDDQGRKTLFAYYATYYADADLWIGITREEYTYNPNGEQLLSTTYAWDNDHWSGNAKFTYIYDASNREIERLVQSFYINKWINSQRFIKEYKGSKLVKSNEYIWMNDQWIYNARNEWYYDSDSQAKLRREIAGTWNGGVVQSYEDNLHFYACDPHYFTIRFVDEDGTLLESDKVKEGEVPVYGGDTPTKAGNAQYTYTFKGWDKALVAATAHATYTATYTQTVNKYIITFLNDNGATIESKEWEYGATPTCTEPTKEATDEYIYTFAGWNPSVAAVTGDATYTATFTTEANLFTITWVDGDGKTLKTEKVAYGETPAYTGATPTKSETAQYTYAFNNIWLPTIVAATADATYTAQFGSTVRSYTITYVDEADEEIDQEILEYGAMPEPETPTKTSTAQYTYTFDKWIPALAEVTGDATYKALFTSTVKEYKITWKDGDGKTLKTEKVAYGTVPAYTGATPTKTATAQYSYTFTGWDKTPVAVTANATYTAQFSQTVNKYTITFKNENGTTIEAKQWEYGTTPTCATTPTKTATAQYEYEFDGWTPKVVAVTGAATYTAKYKSHLMSYTITFLNDDGSLYEDSVWDYGCLPLLSGDPTKAATAQYTYKFAGWTPAITNVTGAATYTATYTSVVNKYTITWVNDDNTLIDQTVVEYGTIPTHADATKENTAEYTYTFAGWDNTPVAVTGDATYKATFSATKNKYTITWLNDDNTLINQTTVEYGVVPEHADATKENTAEYTYTFAGWDNTPVAVTGDATYKATFDATKNKYTITWLNDDNTLIDNTTVEYGVVPTHADASKENTAEYTYTFAGWDNTPVAVTGDATYKATFSATKNKYTITWLNDDESLIDQTIVEYGVVPTHADATKENTAEYTYTFAGWDNTPVAVTGDATYKATFDATKNSYTITWLNDDNTLIDNTTVEYGVVPTHADASKEATAEYTYTFAGWDNTPVAVTGDATYKATFDATKNKYTITWLNDDNTLIDNTTVEYGVVPTHADASKEATAEYTYTFAGWDNTPVAVTGDATYKATFDATKNKYTITWLNDDNTLIDQTIVEYGVVPTHADATKENTAEYTYTFAGWDNTPVAVTGDATYKATFDATKNKYTITWLNDDESLIDQTIVEYGVVPEHAAATKENTAEYTYTFAGWDNTPVAVTGDATYKATFEATKNKYTITWLNDDNTLIDKTTAEYGVVPTHADATKENTAEYTYTFAGWDNTPVEVTGDATYKATFSATKNKYTITWLNDDESLIDQTIVEYGVVPEHADATKENTAEYTYTFAGWDNTPVAVTGDATYTATFDATKNLYTITWIDGDDNILKTEQVAYGETPEYVGETPTKTETTQYSYEFNNTWSPEVVAVTGDATYTAQFTSIVRKYTITVTAKGWSQQQSLPYGTDLTELVAQIIAVFGDQYETVDSIYTLVGWSPELQIVTEDATYVALYTAVAHKYTVTWLDEDGITVLDEQEVDYGQLPEYAGETPTKEEDEQFTYTFSGWDPEIEVVSGDATYVATYTAEAKPDTGVNTVTIHEPAVKVVENDLLYIIRGGMKWAVQGARVK